MANLKYRYTVGRDGWKLIEPYTPNRAVQLMVSGEVSPWMRFKPELYDVLRDPGESIDRAGERPGLVDTLRNRLDAWWAVPR